MLITSLLRFLTSLLRFTVRSVRRLPVLGSVAAAGWVGYSSLGIDHDLPVPSPLPGETGSIDVVGAGRIAVYEGDRATDTPVVLVHGVHAAASAYDIRPLYAALGWERRVIALDLPGFGQSDRDERTYDPDLMTAAVIGVLEKVAGEPADLVALSLGSEYAAAAANARPDLVRSLTLISPTGLGGAPSGRVASGANPTPRLGFLSNPLVGQAFYDLLVTKPSIRYFLSKSFSGDIDHGYAAYAHLTAHRPGARHAPLAFVSGALFTPDVEETVYRKVSQPTLVIYDKDPYSSFAGLPQLAGDLPNWRAVRIPNTRGLPHFDRPTETVAALTDFWAQIAGSGVAEPPSATGEHETAER